MIKSLFRFSYAHHAKPLFFSRDPEDVHDGMVAFGAFLSRFSLTRAVTGWCFDYEHPILSQRILGISFRNAVGLAAGFDKDAQLTGIMPSVGFGFMEVGSITGEPCLGNPRPRLWRLPESKSLVVWYGLKNKGAEVLSRKLSGRRFDIPLGTSVAMTNIVDNNDISRAIADYAKAFTAFVSIGDYTTVNVSCPNTHGGIPFMEPDNFHSLFTVLDAIKTAKPVFVKLSPDVDVATLDRLLDIMKNHRIHGIICTNLTKKRDNSRIIEKNIPAKGGLSGKAVEQMADDMLAHIYRREGRRFVLIGCGGIFSAEDAYKKIRLGASLLQMITGMIYEGPQLIGDINEGLVMLLTRDGYKNISEAVGVDVRKGD